MFLNRPSLLAIAFAICLTTSQAKADLILGNLPASAGSGSTSIELTFGLEFKTGSSNQVLDSASFVIRQLPTANVQVSLNAYDPTHSSTPGAQLALLNSPALSDLPPQTEVFTASQPITLLANTNYWLVLKADPGDFGFITGSTPVGPGATYVADYFDSPFFAANSGIPAFSVNGAAVPEPSSLVLLAIASVIGIIRRVRQSSAPGGQNA